MTLSIDMRRATLFLLALLIFMAVAGPACLVTAASAMGMPTTSAPGAPMDCDRDAERSMSACPHSNRPLPATHQSAQADPVPLDVVFVAPEVLPADITIGRLAPRAEGPMSPPPSHLTPLRI